MTKPKSLSLRNILEPHWQALSHSNIYVYGLSRRKFTESNPLTFVLFNCFTNLPLITFFFTEGRLGNYLFPSCSSFTMTGNYIDLIIQFNNFNSNNYCYSSLLTPQYAFKRYNEGIWQNFIPFQVYFCESGALLARARFCAPSGA